MSTKISELSALSGGIPATNAVPISVSGTTYRVNLGDLAELNGSADVKTALASANKAALSDAVVDGTAIDPSSIGATTPTSLLHIEAATNGAKTFAVEIAGGGSLLDVNTSTRFTQLGGDVFGVSAYGGIYIYNNGFLGWNNDSIASGTASVDLIIRRDAANTLAQRNGTNAQESRLYGTFTSSTNYERLSTKYDSGAGAFVIGTEKGSGGGTARPLILTLDGTTRATFATSGAVTFTNDLICGNNFYLGATGALCFGSNRCITTSPANGIIRMTNDNQNDFTRLQFGGGTSSYPAIKRTSSDIEIVKADGTAADTAIILSSPNGTRYRITVSDIGVLTTTVV